MSIKIEIDRDLCDGLGNCVAAAPDDQADEVRRAAYDCPTSATSHDAG